MTRRKHRKLLRNRRAPFWGRFLRRHFGVEQLCDECSKPYFAKHGAPPIDHLVKGSADAAIFLEHRFGKPVYYFRFGRFGATHDQLINLQLVPSELLADLLEVVKQAQSFVREQKQQAPRLKLVSRK